MFCTKEGIFVLRLRNMMMQKQYVLASKLRIFADPNKKDWGLAFRRIWLVNACFTGVAIAGTPSKTLGLSD